jgi:hypothetical protein
MRVAYLSAHASISATDGSGEIIGIALDWFH